MLMLCYGFSADENLVGDQSFQYLTTNDMKLQQEDNAKVISTLKVIEQCFSNIKIFPSLYSHTVQGFLFLTFNFTC